MDKTISVIVPVYNIKPYLAQSVNSILNQTYRALQIILIDDGSTDGSGQLCDHLAQQDCRIQVIHQSNGGAASAKNAGLRAATGEYLSFVDSDDYLEADAYRFMVDKMETYNADVVRCSFRNIWKNRIGEERFADQSEILYTAESFLSRFTCDWTCGLLWDKLYRRALFDGIFFGEGRRIDDEFFTYQGIMNSNLILSTPKLIYNYRMRKSSVMVRPDFKEQIILDKLAYSKQRREKVLERYPALKPSYDDHYANFLLLLTRDPSATFKTIRQTKAQMIHFLFENPKISIQLKWQLLHALCIKIDQTNNRRDEKATKNLADYFE